MLSLCKEGTLNCSWELFQSGGGGGIEDKDPQANERSSLVAPGNHSAPQLRPMNMMQRRLHADVEFVHGPGHKAWRDAN